MAGMVPDENKRVDYNTPQWVVDATKRVYGGGIDLDPCGNSSSLVAPYIAYSLPHKNGLEESWDYKTIFINPPYGRCYLHKQTLELLDPKKWKDLTKLERSNYLDTSIEDWIEKAKNTYYQYGHSITMLIPAYVNAGYYHDHVLNGATAICFPEGRMTFEGADMQAAFHVCLPFYGRVEATQKFQAEFSRYGKVVIL